MDRIGKGVFSRWIVNSRWFRRHFIHLIHFTFDWIRDGSTPDKRRCAEPVPSFSERENDGKEVERQITDENVR